MLSATRSPLRAKALIPQERGTDILDGLRQLRMSDRHYNCRRSVFVETERQPCCIPQRHAMADIADGRGVALPRQER